MGVTQIKPPRLHICSLEDEPKTIAGPLSSLGFHGHQIARCENLPSARKVLSEHDIDMLLADEHVAGDQDAGTNLITELKAGEFGPRNIDAAFGFITGSRSWVDVKRVSGYTGYLGVLVKGDGLTTKLEGWAKTVRTGIYEGEGPRKLRRIPLFLEGVEFAEDEPMNVLLSIPAWDVKRTVPFPVAKIPVQMQDRLDQLVEHWFIARVSLYESDPEEMVIRDWEIQEPLRDDDGFA
jgi:hypothetical protein